MLEIVEMVTFMVTGALILVNGINYDCDEKVIIIGIMIMLLGVVHGITAYLIRKQDELLEELGINKKQFNEMVALQKEINFQIPDNYSKRKLSKN